MTTLPQEDAAFGVMPAEAFNLMLQRAIHEQNLATIDADDPLLPRDIGEALDVTAGVRSLVFVGGGQCTS